MHLVSTNGLYHLEIEVCFKSFTNTFDEYAFFIQYEWTALHMIGLQKTCAAV